MKCLLFCTIREFIAICKSTFKTLPDSEYTKLQPFSDVLVVDMLKEPQVFLQGGMIPLTSEQQYKNASTKMCFLLENLAVCANPFFEGMDYDTTNISDMSLMQGSLQLQPQDFTVLPMQDVQRNRPAGLITTNTLRNKATVSNVFFFLQQFTNNLALNISSYKYKVLKYWNMLKVGEQSYNLLDAPGKESHKERIQGVSTALDAVACTLLGYYSSSVKAAGVCQTLIQPVTRARKVLVGTYQAIRLAEDAGTIARLLGYSPKIPTIFPKLPFTETSYEFPPKSYTITPSEPFRDSKGVVVKGSAAASEASASQPFTPLRGYNPNPPETSTCTILSGTLLNGDFGALAMCPGAHNTAELLNPQNGAYAGDEFLQKGEQEAVANLTQEQQDFWKELGPEGRQQLAHDLHSQQQGNSRALVVVDMTLINSDFQKALTFSEARRITSYEFTQVDLDIELQKSPVIVHNVIQGAHVVGAQRWFQQGNYTYSEKIYGGGSPSSEQCAFTVVADQKGILPTAQAYSKGIWDNLLHYVSLGSLLFAYVPAEAKGVGVVAVVVILRYVAKRLLQKPVVLLNPTPNTLQHIKDAQELTQTTNNEIQKLRESLQELNELTQNPVVKQKSLQRASTAPASLTASEQLPVVTEDDEEEDEEEDEEAMLREIEKENFIQMALAYTAAILSGKEGLQYLFEWGTSKKLSNQQIKELLTLVQKKKEDNELPTVSEEAYELFQQLVKKYYLHLQSIERSFLYDKTTNPQGLQAGTDKFIETLLVKLRGLQSDTPTFTR